MTRQQIYGFNPCYPFNTALLEAMLDKHLLYFVRSSYARGMEAGATAAFQMSHYTQRAEAARHFQAVPNDPHRFLYDAGIPADVEKLRKAASQIPGYPVYSKIFIPGIEKEISRRFQGNTQRYLRKHTAWDLKGASITEWIQFQPVSYLIIRW